MRKISREELQEYLDEILDCGAFELHKKKCGNGKWEFYIPYMMNDAVECYLILKSARMTGVYEPESEAEITAELVETEQGPAAFFRQGENSVFSIWYEDSFCEQKCYRYDQIGHFWVKGEEHWRRLVYIIGTIHDKFRYMGPDSCNEKEQALIPLMEFAPFRFFSPIHESLDSYYEETTEGFACMKALAEEAGDTGILRLMKLYELSPFKSQMVRQLANAMQSPKRNKLYQLIFYKVEEAASEYPERMYSDGLQESIKHMREEVEERLLKNGFTGMYPLFHKGNIQILAMEEHPFTILESEHYGFKIQYMVSECEVTEQSEMHAEGNGYLLNAGFFRKKGNHGRIEKELFFN